MAWFGGAGHQRRMVRRDMKDDMKAFIEEQPLYTRTAIALYTDRPYPDVIELECSMCKAIRPFHKSLPKGLGTPPGPRGPGIVGTPYVAQSSGGPAPHSESSSTQDNTTSAPRSDLNSTQKDTTPARANEVHSLHYICTGCKTEQFQCWIEVNYNQGWIRKVGQIPPWSKVPEKQLTKLLSKHQSYYRKGMACESQSYGIGAYAYYRRIVEDIIDDLLESITDLIDPSEREKYLDNLKETKKTIVAQEKIALVKELLPPILRPNDMNPLSILHSALSEGIHVKTDEECLETAQHVREILIFLASEIAYHRESSKRFTDAMRKLLSKR